MLNICLYLKPCRVDVEDALPNLREPPYCASHQDFGGFAPLTPQDLRCGGSKTWDSIIPTWDTIADNAGISSNGIIDDA